MSVVFGHSVAVLTTTGRRSGNVRRTPVTYLPYEDGYLIGGGAGGQKATPDWVWNLRATPEASLLINRAEIRCTVSEPGAADRDRAFEAMATKWPEVRKYERWGGRPLPLFFFRPIA